MSPVTWLLFALLACRGKAGEAEGSDGEDGSGEASDGGVVDGGGDEGGGDSAAEGWSLRVTVTLDGAPAPGVRLTQPGTSLTWSTDAAGQAEVELRADLDGGIAIAASHPEARVGGYEFYPSEWGTPTLTIPLTRFDPTDNAAYTFLAPGTPESGLSTEFCTHCHVRINADWYASPHARSASNPVVHDLYAGVAAAWADEAGCLARGGIWRSGLVPGSAARADRCYIGEGTLPSLNADCGVTESCDGVAAETGDCADCHAPGINGALGGRDLLEATEEAYEHGVHCDVCHKAESVDPDDPRPGVAGKLHVLRPIEPSPSPAMGEWAPTQFGPYGDVLNPFMGAIERDQFTEASFCAGCHQYDAPVRVVGGSVDLSRWPDGLLPVQSTWAEWEASPMSPDVPCQSCHMPPDPHAGNSADLGHEGALDEGGTVGGWYRPPGEVRRHAWFGPRSAEQRLLELAARVELEGELSLGELEARVTVTNSGPGHALPTGEPLRSLLLLVEARCDGDMLESMGGDVISDVGGALDEQAAGEDWSRWPGALVGDRVRVLRETGDWLDYTGPGPFGDGRFDTIAKGMPIEVLAGESEITAVDSEGRVSLSAPLPEGDRAVRVEADGGLPEDGDPARAWSGAPGFAYSRVLVGPDGARNVPHFRAVDVVSDNRLPAGQSWTTVHRFAATCEHPVVEAVLVHRAYPLELAAERGWALTESVMARETLEIGP